MVSLSPLLFASLVLFLFCDGLFTTLTEEEQGLSFERSLPFYPGITTPEQLADLAQLLRKPAVAIIRSRRCPVCQNFVKDVNRRKSNATELLQKVIAVDISDDRTQYLWKAFRGFNEHYIPRVYMFDPSGQVLDLFAPRDDDNKYAYWKSEQLENNIRYVCDMHSNLSDSVGRRLSWA
eukprot:TRINITY_DN58032_c0_g1_i1.p1 TRINITY_DN58032_c0_g1~~TRINITY_DN58032_c0_g1_i1.p1  ORF type:complete len:178 (+),score=18.04 TRINITY_DN58032_c0_g1_i1:65-598(+)